MVITLAGLIFHLLTCKDNTPPAQIDTPCSIWSG